MRERELSIIQYVYINNGISGTSSHDNEQQLAKLVAWRAFFVRYMECELRVSSFRQKKAVSSWLVGWANKP